MRVAVTGGTGFIGRALVRALRGRSDSVAALARDPARAKSVLGEGIAAVRWEAGGAPGPWREDLARADAVVNLAGEGVMARRWTAAQKARIVSSRVGGTQQLVETIARSEKRPRVLINASAVGYYGPRGDEPVDEMAPPGQDFLAKMVVDWEAEAVKAEADGVRVVRLRTGIVLERDGGALAQMIPPFKLFLGGPLGSGRQYFPWVHRDDVVGIILYAIEHPEVRGAINATAPYPVTNREFCAALGRALGRPSWAPVPAFVLRLMIGEAAYVILTGQNAVPAAITAAGYRYKYPDLDEALRSIVR